MHLRRIPRACPWMNAILVTYKVFTLVYLVLRRMPVLRSSSCYCYGGWIVPLSSTVPPGRDGVTKWYHALARGAPYKGVVLLSLIVLRGLFQENAFSPIRRLAGKPDWYRQKPYQSR